ncbi:ornithine cyclodeaminase family protein [Bradyrhizobium sp. Cp5.3]|uniref:ornithine cyclodeaminase family protein n=1 Tax=Bradyrhizobium sp. Cp5.3 TaxID=443598 RepID=UPI0003F6FD99|nr:ornithine cyclodeaminase family protein [Bradyrhizobium sp. Cp5.3]
MIFISEQETAAAISHELAFDAVREALILAVSSNSKVFPAVIAHGSDSGNRFSVKAGIAGDIAGTKMGFNWPANKKRGIPSHNSVTILIDQTVGRIGAVVEAGLVNAYRTSAADAVAADSLARSDSRSLAVFGAGNQAGYECLALAKIRPIDRVLVVTQDIATEGDRFIARLAKHGLRAEIANAEAACRAADMIVTATPSTAPLFEADWVKPGTHISSMGADSKGKQELPPALFKRAKLFCDLPEQSTTIGEFQHAASLIASGGVALTAIGLVLTDKATGRTSPDDITIFDSSGISLQDLCVCQKLVELLRPGKSKTDEHR